MVRNLGYLDDFEREKLLQGDMMQCLSTTLDSDSGHLTKDRWQYSWRAVVIVLPDIIDIESNDMNTFDA